MYIRDVSNQAAFPSYVELITPRKEDVFKSKFSLNQNRKMKEDSLLKVRLYFFLKHLVICYRTTHVFEILPSFMVSTHFRFIGRLVTSHQKCHFIVFFLIFACCFVLRLYTLAVEIQNNFSIFCCVAVFATVPSFFL